MTNPNDTDTDSELDDAAVEAKAERIANEMIAEQEARQQEQFEAAIRAHAREQIAQHAPDEHDSAELDAMETEKLVRLSMEVNPAVETDPAKLQEQLLRVQNTPGVTVDDRLLEDED